MIVKHLTLKFLLIYSKLTFIYCLYFHTFALCLPSDLIVINNVLFNMIGVVSDNI